MPIAKKPKPISPAFSPAQIAAALAAAAPAVAPETPVDWSKGVATPGGGVAKTISQLRRARGKNKSPTKEQVAIRLDPGVLAAFRASGRDQSGFKPHRQRDKLAVAGGAIAAAHPPIMAGRPAPRATHAHDGFGVQAPAVAFGSRIGSPHNASSRLLGVHLERDGLTCRSFCPAADA